MRIPFAQIDAFADTAFAGNPAAVMPLAASEARKAAVAAVSPIVIGRPSSVGLIEGW